MTTLTIPNGDPDFAFEGFEATGGEYFTGFEIDTQGSGYLPGVTNLEVGLAESSTPEPGTAALLGLTLGSALLILLGHKILTALMIVPKGLSVNRDGCCPGADPDCRGDLQACLDGGSEQAADGSQLPGSA